MNGLRKGLGLIWMLLAPAAMGFLIYAAVKTVRSNAKGDIANPVPWLIVILIFTPIAIGLVLFGWYSWKGEYDREA